MATLQKKKRLLTGIRASGEIHLGNYLGAMAPAIAKQNDYESYLFIADLHGLTTHPKASELRAHVYNIAAAWLASGLDPEKVVFWRQSDVPEVLELSYLLSCVTSMGLLERAHSYKDAMAKEKVVKSGLFFYPVLMAADILLYSGEIVPVGKDQLQHLEMARDMATYFNEIYGDTLTLPEAVISASAATVPGTDGRKMSKSYDNGIHLFANEAQIKKEVMGIKTDSKGLAEPKEAESNIIYQIYKEVAPVNKVAELKQKLEAGGFGYGDAKKLLLAEILEKFAGPRKVYAELMANPPEMERLLAAGAVKARAQATKMIQKLRSAVGLPARS